LSKNKHVRGKFYKTDIYPYVVTFCKTQEELDAEMFSEFTSPVGMELTNKEEIKKIEKKSSQH
jgi:hypothetical protein